jgi:hypothetical protein
MPPPPTIPIVPRFMDMAVVDHFVYITSTTEGLFIVDISNPKNPVLLPQDMRVPTSEGTGSITVAGNYAYSLWGGALEIKQIFNPTSPKVIFSATFPIDVEPPLTNGNLTKFKWLLYINTISSSKSIIDIVNLDKLSEIFDLGMNVQ